MAKKAVPKKQKSFQGLEPRNLASLIDSIPGESRIRVIARRQYDD